MNFRWQNLNERPRSKIGGFTPREKNLPTHGRCWISSDDSNSCFRIEWDVLSKSCMLTLHVNPFDDDNLQFHIGLPPISLYFSLEDRRLGKLLESIVSQPSDMDNKYSGREVSLRVHNWALWWNLWVDQSGWTHTRSKWRDGNFNFPDFFLGKFKHSERLLERQEIEIRMLEGAYKGICEMKEGTWKRPHWPFPKRVVRAHIDMTEPVPIPGKGENSWDCGQDAVHGSTFMARNVADAIGKMTGDILQTRERRSGLNWRAEVKRAG